MSAGENFCDDCGQEMVTVDGVTGWIVPTGEVDEEFGVPVVRMICRDCR